GTGERGVSACAGRARAVAGACATMLVAVISPLKTLRLLTWAEAVALASTSVDADALAFAEPVVTSTARDVGSAYVKPPLNATWSSGAETARVAPPGPLGTTTRIACARAVDPDAWVPCQPASAEAAASRSKARGATIARFSTGAELCTSPASAGPRRRPPRGCRRRRACRSRADGRGRGRRPQPCTRRTPPRPPT